MGSLTLSKMKYFFLVGSFMLVLICCINAFDFSVFAAETGSCGESVTYSYDQEKEILTISGTGDMYDYEYDNGTTTAPYFQYLSRVKEIHIKEGVTGIGKLAFAFSFALTKVDFPSTLTRVKTDAFLGAVSLQKIYIPNNVTEIGSCAFGYKLNGGVTGDHKAIDMVIVADAGSAAATYADEKNFECFNENKITGECGDTATWELDILNGVLYIKGSGKMKSFYTFTTICHDYRNLVTKVVFDDEITSIGAYAFYTYKSIKEVVFPKDLYEIDSYAFGSCYGLTELSFPDGLSIIGENSFNSCYGLEEINIPKSVGTIKRYAFSGCNIKKFNVSPNNNSYEDVNGILYSKGLKWLTLVPSGYENSFIFISPETTYVKDGAFSNVKNKQVYFYNYIQDLSDHVLRGNTYYYDASDSRWNNYLENTPEAIRGKWIDISSCIGKTDLTLIADKNNLQLGEYTQLTAEVDPYILADLKWCSSDESVLQVNSTGLVTAVGAGSASIYLKNKAGDALDSVEITVSEDTVDFENHSLKLFKENYKVDSQARFYPCEKLGGVFYRTGYLFFYSFLSGTIENLGDVGGAAEKNVLKDNKLYYCENGRIYVYDLLKKETTLLISIPDALGPEIGIDDSGRLLVSYREGDSVQKLFLYSSDGKLLDEIVSPLSISKITGIEGKKGFFFYETFYDTIEWGYEKTYITLQLGKIAGEKLSLMSVETTYMESGQITRYVSGLETLYNLDNYSNNHRVYAEMLDGRLLTTCSERGRVCVFDTETLDDQGIDLLLQVGRSMSDNGDTSSVGVLSIYNQANNSIVMYENNNQITEYSLADRSKLSTVNTAYKVFTAFRYGTNLVLIEKSDTDTYIETIDYSKLDSIKIDAPKTELMSGESEQLTAEIDSYYDIKPKWTTSDSSVLTVTNDGLVSAWKEGTAVITASINGEISDSVTIKVTKSNAQSPTENVSLIDGAHCANVSNNDYYVYTETIKSYMYENPDDSISTVEWDASQSKVYIRTFEKDETEKAPVVIDAPLPRFGGFYSGKEYNYLVFGQNNESASDDVEVIRVLRYSKDYSQVTTLSIKGENTKYPFEAGGLSMTESVGKLYIHTCHIMYSDHQANMSFVIDEDSFTVVDKYTDIMNIAQAGYVSHSFNQLVAADDDYVFRVDHGDNNPRAITITRAKTDGRIRDVGYGYLLEIGTYGTNATGATVGGLELSGKNVLVAGSSVDQNQHSTSGSRNVFVTVNSKRMDEYDIRWLTDYPLDSKITACNPQLVKLSDNCFLIMWEEYDTEKKEVKTKIASINNRADVAELVTTDLRLSDCKPIFCSDGLVRWFVTDLKTMQMVTINPYDLSSISGKVVVDEAADDPSYNPGTDDDYNDDSTDDSTDDHIGEPIVIETEGGNNPSGKNNYSNNSRKKIYTYDYEDDTESNEPLRIGQKFTKDDGSIYTVTGKDTVEFSGYSGKQKNIEIPATISQNGITYKVISIGKNAFKGCSSLTKVIIGSNVKTIGAGAFYNCKKLKSIIIKSLKLKTVGKNAIKNIYKKAVIKAPKKKLKAYKKLFKKKTGFKKPMKIKKSK